MRAHQHERSHRSPKSISVIKPVQWPVVTSTYPTGQNITNDFERANRALGLPISPQLVDQREWDYSETLGCDLRARKRQPLLSRYTPGTGGIIHRLCGTRPVELSQRARCVLCKAVWPTGQGWRIGSGSAVLVFLRSMTNLG
jgi:hypothetical protein